MRLTDQDCAPVTRDVAPLTPAEATELAREIPQWNLRADALEREFTFSGFAAAMDFVNEVADLAQEQDHHPDIHVSYNKVRFEFSTHAIGGLSRNDFIMAAKVDELAL